MTNHDAYAEGYDAYWDGVERDENQRLHLAGQGKRPFFFSMWGVACSA